MDSITLYMQRELIYTIKKGNESAKTKSLITATAQKQQKQRAKEEDKGKGI